MKLRSIARCFFSGLLNPSSHSSLDQHVSVHRFVFNRQSLSWPRKKLSILSGQLIENISYVWYLSIDFVGISLELLHVWVYLHLALILLDSLLLIVLYIKETGHGLGLVDERTEFLEDSLIPLAFKGASDRCHLKLRLLVYSSQYNLLWNTRVSSSAHRLLRLLPDLFLHLNEPPLSWQQELFLRGFLPLIFLGQKPQPFSFLSLNPLSSLVFPAIGLLDLKFTLPFLLNSPLLKLPWNESLLQGILDVSRQNSW